MVFKMGGIARMELNYVVPQGAQRGDGYVVTKSSISTPLFEVFVLGKRKTKSKGRIVYYQVTHLECDCLGICVYACACYTTAFG